MTKNQKAFLCAVQRRCARIAVSASATRKQGRGAVAAARQFLGELPLDRFGVSRSDLIRCRIDEETKKLKAALPAGTRSWGLARKLLNIFLRDAMYTTYLRRQFRLGRAERSLEIPLDSITAKMLKRSAGRGALPMWKGVKNLTPQDSEKFQRHAQAIAAARRLPRVHLDTYWWGERTLDV